MADGGQRRPAELRLGGAVVAGYGKVNGNADVELVRGAEEPHGLQVGAGDHGGGSVFALQEPKPSGVTALAVEPVLLKDTQVSSCSGMGLRPSRLASVDTGLDRVTDDQRHPSMVVHHQEVLHGDRNAAGGLGANGGVPRQRGGGVDQHDPGVHAAAGGLAESSPTRPARQDQPIDLAVAQIERAAQLDVESTPELVINNA